MAVVDSGFNQTSAGGLDDADSLLCIQRGLESGWNKTEVFTAVVKPELLAYLSNGSFVSNVILNKLFFLRPNVVRITVKGLNPGESMLWFE